LTTTMYAIVKNVVMPATISRDMREMISEVLRS
jgi:hypothetical protein